MYLRLSASQIGEVIDLEPAKVNILLDEQESEEYLMHDDGEDDILMHDDNEDDLILTQ
jgi:hypothetical protein